MFTLWLSGEVLYWRQSQSDSDSHTILSAPLNSSTWVVNGSTWTPRVLTNSKTPEGGMTFLGDNLFYYELVNNTRRYFTVPHYISYLITCYQDVSHTNSCLKHSQLGWLKMLLGSFMCYCSCCQSHSAILPGSWTLLLQLSAVSRWTWRGIDVLQWKQYLDIDSLVLLQFLSNPVNNSAYIWSLMLLLQLLPVSVNNCTCIINVVVVVYINFVSKDMAACVIRDGIKKAVELLQQKYNTDNFIC